MGWLHKYGMIIALVSGTFVIIGSMWGVGAKADEFIGVVRKNTGDILDLTALFEDYEKEQLEQNKEFKVQLNAMPQAVIAATKNTLAIEKIVVQAKLTGIHQQIAVANLNLEQIKREKRTLTSKDKYGSINQWESAELLMLTDDVDRIESKIQHLRLDIQRVSSSN